MVLLVEEYFELTTKYKAIYGENTIVLMQVGAFFEVYGTKKNTTASSIHDFSRICDLNIANKNRTQRLESNWLVIIMSSRRNLDLIFVLSFDI